MLFVLYVLGKGENCIVNLKEMIGQERINKGLWWSQGLCLVEGCSHAGSPSCDNCWSLTSANIRQFNPNPKIQARYEGTVDNSGLRPRWTGQVNPQWQDLDKIGRSRTPKVYTFWNDLFHPGVPDEFIHEVLVRIFMDRAKTIAGGGPGHFFIICTKRLKRALPFFQRYALTGPIKNLMVMTTAENQEWADRRIPILLQIPGVLHGVNYEPALDPIDFTKPLGTVGDRGNWVLKQAFGNPRPLWACAQCDGTGYRETDPWAISCSACRGSGVGIDWIPAGGETGPHARPSHPDWFRRVRDDCYAVGVPFFFKSWGKNIPEDQSRPRFDSHNNHRLLDGQQWSQVPHV
jgi:protein gp37